MRNISLISILLALVFGALIWSKQLKEVPTPGIPSNTGHEDHADTEPSTDGLTECDGSGFDENDCEAESAGTEQDEMEDQRSRAYGTIMDSFDTEYNKYREQTGGRP